MRHFTLLSPSNCRISPIKNHKKNSFPVKLKINTKRHALHQVILTTAKGALKYSQSLSICASGMALPVLPQLTQNQFAKRETCLGQISPEKVMPPKSWSLNSRFGSPTSLPMERASGRPTAVHCQMPEPQGSAVPQTVQESTWPTWLSGFILFWHRQIFISSRGFQDGTDERVHCTGYESLLSCFMFHVSCRLCKIECIKLSANVGKLTCRIGLSHAYEHMEWEDSTRFAGCFPWGHSVLEQC
jgi:hypothetical protein